MFTFTAADADADGISMLNLMTPTLNPCDPYASLPPPLDRRPTTHRSVTCKLTYEHSREMFSPADAHSSPEGLPLFQIGRYGAIPKADAEPAARTLIGQPRDGSVRVERYGGPLLLPLPVRAYLGLKEQERW
jgi:hypothetical protein